MSEEPVTPDTLTDDMILSEFRIECTSISLFDAWFATSDEPDGPRKMVARQRICDAINAKIKP